MAKIVNFFKTLRNNWKKTTFAVLLASYGADYAYERHKTFHMMKTYCEEAAAYGHKPLPMGARNKHVTLFLNPTAGNRKSVSKFEKYAEPLIHLSGFLVNIVKTERISEARDLAALIEKTNVVAVAGGDGTLFEIITGLFRREDAEEAFKKYPVAIIPVGGHNEFGRRLFHKEGYSEAKMIAESALAVVKHNMVPQDVMEIKVIDDSPNDTEVASTTDISGEQDPANSGSETPKENKPLIKPVYAMSGIKIGQFREAELAKEKMPNFFGDKFSTIWSHLRVPKVENFKAEINYIPACSGCVKCKIEEPVPKKSALSTLTRVLSLFRPVLAQEIVKDENPECGVWTSLCVEAPEFNIMCNGKGRLVMEVGEKHDWTELISEGLRRLKGHPKKLSKTIECSEAEIKTISSPEFCSIDNEEFEVKKMKVKVMRNKVYFFVS